MEATKLTMGVILTLAIGIPLILGILIFAGGTLLAIVGGVIQAISVV